MRNFPIPLWSAVPEIMTPRCPELKEKFRWSLALWLLALTIGVGLGAKAIEHGPSRSSGDWERLALFVTGTATLLLTVPRLWSQRRNARVAHDHLLHLVGVVAQDTPDALVLVDSAGRLVYTNSSFQQWTAGAVSLGSDLLALVRESEREPAIVSLRITLSGGGPTSLGLVPPNGVLLQGVFHSVQRQGEKPLAMGVFRDVSVGGGGPATEAEPVPERASQSQKVEALSRLAGGVAHDFNNLLAIMMLNLDAIDSALDKGNPARRHVDEISLAARKAAGITRQLLLYSRRTGEPQGVSCHSLVDDTGRLTRGLRGTIRFETALGASHDRVLIEEGQLDQVLLNLVVNAKDAVGADGLVRIETENRRLEPGNRDELAPGEYLLLRVSDNGSGIPSALQDKVFEPYFTTKAKGKGTGLGLATVSVIVEKAGGKVKVQSKPGSTTFEILLPAAVRRALPSLPVVEPVEAAAPPAKAGRTVLLVEDEAPIRALVHRLLEGKGYTVTSVSGGQAAVELMGQKDCFDVLITDISLPGMQGPDIAKAFHRAQSRGRVLFMSGCPSSAVDIKRLPQNTCFLAKPFSPGQLFGALDELMQPEKTLLKAV